ncbi:MAG: molybdopterin-dependent oxidoreductase [Thermodesulfobacteriota bacterium]
MVQLVIDNTEVTADPGTTILDAARQVGISIPTLCHDTRLKPYGACGLCMVETRLNGRQLVLPSCVSVVEQGMEVATDTPELAGIRRTQLMLLLRSHPLRCPECDAGGDCRLQELVHEHEIPALPFDREERSFHVDNDSHFIRFNMDVCVKCGLCIRICDEIQGTAALGFVNRGTGLDVTPAFGQPLECEFCGQCAQICPVGAITSKWLVGTGRRFELEKTSTACSFCSLGCALEVSAKDGRAVQVNSPATGPNEGNLCVKGRYGWPYVYSDKRLTRPLIRKQGALVETDWTEALCFVAEEFKRIRQTSGPQSLAALGSARLTNEEAFTFGRFVRTVLGTPHLDHGAGYSYRPLLDALGAAFGYPAGTNSIREIRDAQVILLLCADLSETNPVAKNEVVLATSPDRAGRVVVVDSVRTDMWDRRGMHLLTPPGTEHLIAYSMLNVLLHESSGTALVGNNADYGDALIRLHDEYRPDRVAARTGVNEESIRQAAEEYAQAATATIVLTAGMHQRGNSVALAQAAADLALVTGRLGRRCGGVHVLGEKANAQGALDMGLSPGLLPGFRDVRDPDARRVFEAAWSRPLPREKGFGAREILKEAELGAIRGLYVVGENPLENYPDRRQVRKALEALDLLVVQEMFLSATAEHAHVVLPVAGFGEKTGTYTSAERRVQLVRPFMKSRGVMTDLEILQSLATLMGDPTTERQTPAQVFADIAQLVEEYGGLCHGRLSPYGLQWPCVDREDPGSERLYGDRFPRGKPRLLSPPPIDEGLADRSLFRIIPRPVKFHSGSLSQWSPSLMEVCPEGWIEMHLSDLQTLGVQEGDKVRITLHGKPPVEGRVRWSRHAVPGTVLVPPHFRTLKLNNATRWDRTPVCVTVEKCRESDEIAETHELPSSHWDSATP